MKILKSEKHFELQDKRKELRSEINEHSKIRDKKRIEIKSLTCEIRKLKKKLKTVTNKIGK